MRLRPLPLLIPPHFVVGSLLLALSGPSLAAPNCAVGATRNIVVMNVSPSPPGKPWLQSTTSSTRIILTRCSFQQLPGGTCFFAADVPAGRYYFREVMTGVMNDLTYPVSTASLWFEVSPLGTTYLGDWSVKFGDQRVIEKLEIHYELNHLDKVREICGLPAQRLFLGRTKLELAEIID